MLIQDRWATALGCEPPARTGVVAAMMRVTPSERAAYWLQLALSVGIATMGLVLDSGAVVIAAMLVAPLMTPIVNLGMGLAIGSPLLVLRSGARVVVSVLIAVASSAVLVRSLPFQASTAEIAARTTPTALDLATASFCALAGVYAAMRPSSDVASTAAGTSIGISLVPPLCVCGYGLGAFDLRTASGAALLFVTNLVAIVFVGTIAFMIFGFNRVDVRAIERDLPEGEGGGSFAARVARRLTSRSTSLRSIALRLAMPVVLLAAVFVPLRTALDEVAWEIRVRGRTERLLASIEGDILESRVRIDRRAVELAVVLIGTTSEAQLLHERLEREITEIAGSPPRLAVYAVPDAAAFAGLEDALRRRPGPVPVQPVVEPAPAPVPEPEPDGERLTDVLSVIAGAVETRWPVEVLGPVLSLRVRTLADDRSAVAIVHHGPALDPATQQLLQTILAEDLERAVVVEDEAIPALPLVPQRGLDAFAVEIGGSIERARAIEELWLCVDTVPEPPPRRSARRAAPAPDPGRELVMAAIADFPRLQIREAESWRVRFARGGCEAAAVAPDEIDTP